MIGFGDRATANEIIPRQSSIVCSLGRVGSPSPRLPPACATLSKISKLGHKEQHSSPYTVLNFSQIPETSKESDYALPCNFLGFSKGSGLSRDDSRGPSSLQALSV